MSDKKQSDVKQPGWLCKTFLWSARIVLGLLVIAISYCICSPYLSPERRATNNDHTRLGWYLIGLAFTGGVVLCIPRIITSNPKKYFITRVLVTGITGGAFALLLPIAVKSTTTGVGGLRHSILLATGGLLAILTLGETRRKNDIDKRKNKQEKKKNDKDHRRQVRAERRERYTKAVEQLGDEKAPIRMGGVYTLVGLVDEWLEDESIDKYEDRLKEGQVIINNLCAYIRSPFTLASHYDELSQDTPTTEVIYKDSQQKSHKKWQIISNTLYACIRSQFTPDSRHDELSQDSYTYFYKDREQEFYADKANLESEADVRLSIIKEIHDRLQGPEENTPGTWSDFEYDFSGSTFFYPIDLTNSRYTKPINFSDSIYKEGADFRGSTYTGRADFRGSTYTGRAIFTGSTYQWADFTDSTYQEGADFTGSTYQWADFTDSTYQGGADFSDSIYKSWASFTRSTYQEGADFSNSTYQGWANFSNSTYQGWANFTDSTYKGAYFTDSTYQGGAYFTDSTYQGGAYFSNSTYQSWAGFSNSTYEDETDFSGSIFYQETYFSEDGDNSSFSRFTDCTPQFYNEKSHQNALFGSHNNDFTVDIDKGYPINLDSEGIPLNCKFLTSEQKEYLADKFHEIEKTNNEFFKMKDPKEKAELSKKLQALNEELHEWREKNTTVKVEDIAAENTES